MVDEDEVDGEGDENRGGGEFEMLKIVEVGEDGEGEGGNADGEADRDGVFEDILVNLFLMRSVFFSKARMRPGKPMQVKLRRVISIGVKG